MAESVDARQDHKSETEPHAHVRHGSMSVEVYGSSAWTDHNEHERANRFGEEPRSAHLIVARIAIPGILHQELLMQQARRS